MTAPPTYTTLYCTTCDGYRPADRRTRACRLCGAVCGASRGPMAPLTVDAPVTQPLALWPTTPPTNGTVTSQAAADSLSEQALTEQQRRVLNALWKARPGGLTDEEIQRITGLNPSSERPRRGELLAQGWIEDSGTTRPTESGRSAVVWRVSQQTIARARNPEQGAAA